VISINECNCIKLSTSPQAARASSLDNGASSWRPKLAESLQNLLRTRRIKDVTSGNSYAMQRHNIAFVIASASRNCGFTFTSDSTDCQDSLISSFRERSLLDDPIMRRVQLELTSKKFLSLQCHAARNTSISRFFLDYIRRRTPVSTTLIDFKFIRELSSEMNERLESRNWLRSEILRACNGLRFLERH